MRNNRGGNVTTPALWSGDVKRNGTQFDVRTVCYVCCLFCLWVFDVTVVLVTYPSLVLIYLIENEHVVFHVFFSLRGKGIHL